MKNDQKNQEWRNPILTTLEGLVSPIGLPTLSKQNSKNIKKSGHDTQELVNVKCIRNGIICCKDGSFVKILEVLPLNYYQKDVIDKNKITESFMHLFRICPNNLHIKTRTEKADASEIISIIRQNCKQENNEKLNKRAEEYINHIKTLQDENITTKFYVSFAYEGDNGKFSRNFDDIYTTMRRMEMNIRSQLMSTGNLVITPKDENYHACEIFYKYYNPLSCDRENLKERIDRIYSDYNLVGKEQPTEADFIASRGIKSNPANDWLIMDGMYHTWLAFRDDSYPENTQTGWLDNIPCCLGVDKDIFIKRNSRQMVKSGLNQIQKIKYSSYNAHITNPDKAKSLSREIANAEYIRSAIDDCDEDLSSVEVVVTIRSLTYAAMRDMQSSIRSRLDGYSIYTSTSFLTTLEFLKCTAPDMYNNRSLFKKFSHNFLTRNLAQLYPFTAVSLFSNEGYVIGKNLLGGSLVSFNNFDTHLYSNANIVIMGTPGSGKSYLEMMLGYRMRMMGTRVMYIIPLKAHEHLKACEDIGGQYIRLIPGGKACINIMEIRPQVTKDGTLIEDTDEAEGMAAPLLARKIASLCAWLQLNMIDDKLTVAEKNRFNVLCTKLYANYGITTNNDSIWLDKEKRILKTMPILQDLNDALREDPVLSRVKDVLAPYMYGGMFSNFNGYTNVDLNNPYLVFDVDKTAINADYLPAIMYIAFDCCYDLAKQSLMSKDAIFLDEVWLMMQNDDCAKQVKEMVKIIRGYGSCTVLATQDIGDFLRANNGLGESILASSKIKFFLRCEDMELSQIAKVVDLNANDRANFKKFPAHGRTLMMSDRDKMLIELISSEEELRIFTTDVNLRKKFAEQEKSINTA